MRGHRPSEASDVYAVGVVLHRLAQQGGLEEIFLQLTGPEHESAA